MYGHQVQAVTYKGNVTCWNSIIHKYIYLYIQWENLQCAAPAALGLDKLCHGFLHGSAGESACTASPPWHASNQPVPG